MANPKRQHSKQRQRKRRTHYKTATPQLSVCTNCQKLVLPHRVCPFCGFYKGQLVVDVVGIQEKRAKKADK